MRYTVTLDDEPIEVELGPGAIRIDGVEVDAGLRTLEGTGVHALRVGDRVHRVLARRLPDGRWSMHLDGHRIRAEALDERTAHIRKMAGAMAGAAGPRPLKAPMPGLVVQVQVEVGDEVGEGDGIVVVEAMKMENELRAEGPARVTAVRVAAGDAVEKDQILVELGALDGPEADEAEEES